jgi:CRISPR-associated protein Cmr2
MNWYEIFLNKFFHDPIDKPFDIKYHENRAKKYKELFGISSDLEKEFKYADIIASCMERSLIPKDTDNKQIRQEFNEIRHPLSEGRINVEIDREKSIQEISKILEKISESYKSYSEDKKSYAIWRNLLEDILNELRYRITKIFCHHSRRYTCTRSFSLGTLENYHCNQCRRKTTKQFSIFV